MPFQWKLVPFPVCHVLNFGSLRIRVQYLSLYYQVCMLTHEIFVFYPRTVNRIFLPWFIGSSRRFLFYNFKLIFVFPIFFWLWQLRSTMSSTAISRDKVLLDVMGRFDGIFSWLVPIPTDDTSNFIACSDMPDDPFNRIFCFVGSIIVWSSSGERFMQFFGTEVSSVSSGALVTRSIDTVLWKPY